MDMRQNRIHLLLGGFCFVEYYTRQDAEHAMRYINQTRLDDRIIRTDWDAGFIDGRQFGRGRSGGQVRDRNLFVDILITSYHRICSRCVMNIEKIMIQVVVDLANDLIQEWKWIRVAWSRFVRVNRPMSTSKSFDGDYLLSILMIIFGLRRSIRSRCVCVPIKKT